MFDLEGLGLLLIALQQKLTSGHWPTPEALRAHLQALGRQDAGHFGWVSHQPGAAQVLDTVIHLLQLVRQHL